MSEPIKIDAETALRVLDECVNERGEDYVYQRHMPGIPGKIGNTCLYWHGNLERGEPGCLIGLALYKLGVPAVELHKQETNSFEVVAKVFERKGVADVSKDAVDVLAIAQSAQDCGATWGETVATAHDRYNILHHNNS